MGIQLYVGKFEHICDDFEAIWDKYLQWAFFL